MARIPLEKDETMTPSEVAKMVSDIALNGMKVLEVKAYPINDKIKKLKKHSFKAYSLNEVLVRSINTGKEGYVTVNEILDIPIVNLRLEEDGPWYFTNKDKAISKVREMNKIEWDAVKEIKDEIDSAEEYLKDIVENDRF